MTARRLLFAFASALILAGPALAQETPVPGPGAPDLMPPDADDGLSPLAPAIPEIWAPSPVDDQGRSAYGLFLAGRLASARGDAGDGAVYLRRALILTPEQPAVRDQAFATNLLGGDLAFAGRVTPEGEGVPPLVTEAGRLVTLVQTLDRGDARGALAAIDARPIARPHSRAGRLLTPWLAAAAGDWDRALTPVAALGPDSTTLFLRADRARMLEMRRRHAEAEAEWAVVLGTSRGRRLFALDYGAFLERRGRRAEAVTFYEAEIARGETDARLRPARARAASRGRPPAVLDLRQGAAGALTAAALQSSAEGQHEFAAVYLRLAQDLAPSDLTLLNLGDALMQAGLEGPGREVLAGISTADSSLYASAQLSIGESLVRDGEHEAAVEPLTRAVSAAPRAPDAALALARRLSHLDRHAEALDVLSGPAFPQGNTPPAALRTRAVALRALDRDAEAEAALEAVLLAEPEDPEALSLLGGLWLDARRVEEGAALIARAAAVDPEDVAVQGALGWSQYRQGLFDDAVLTLEAAVDARPADAVVNDHLGDAYWQVGRRREARFQWSRALTLDPGADLEAALLRKLEDGLPAAAPAGG
ncbi:MAG: tetratricopeptide repeat protein [Alphaproteobacteria bacterium]|nr:tetratricopeptide repeat protein [Alphaproteobacteria bacterium]MBU1525423.1 tetratricopeptide repeat protein [Alphaproteobacteria bacterium]MBU2351120.1 tetratricopeptide repeat protein [Alphaproteobacteria bacterium]MBU2382828.1 tetratricopeptide repeat protein [Alphaproteobacteria bacterium]